MSSATSTMNPIIKIIGQYMVNGAKPIQVWIDDLEADHPKSIIVRFDDGTDTYHEIESRDNRELYQWYRELSDWWCRLKFEGEPVD